MKLQTPLARGAAVGVLALLAACADRDGTPTLTGPDALLSVAADQDVPARASNPKATFVRMEADSLWTLIAAGDGRAVIGLKSPGKQRGVYRGKRLISQQEERSVTAALRGQPGVTVLDQSEHRPTLLVGIQDAATLRRIMQLPTVDYIEPARVRGDVSYNSEGSGCAYDIWGLATPVHPSGDMVASNQSLMGISSAWKRSNGYGLVIGLTDTGIYQSSTQMVTRFKFGQSANRAVLYDWTSNYTNGWTPESGGCSHGTRMAGVIAAPMDGVGPVGVAWGSSLISERHNADVEAVFDAWHAMEAIDRSVAHGAGIVVMAWGSRDFWFSHVADSIEGWYYYTGRMFVGAAGTSPCWGPAVVQGNVLFPAEMPEVIAVTAVGQDGRVTCDSHYGSEVDMAAYVKQPTTGRGSDVVSIQASSNAAAVIAGAAALVWSEYGNSTNNVGVRNRLQQWSSRRNFRSDSIGYGVPNVYGAVGGFVELLMLRPEPEVAPNTTVYLEARPTGDGPFTYLWNTGATTKGVSFNAGPYGTATYRSVTVTDQVDGTSRSWGGWFNSWSAVCPQPGPGGICPE
jgi:hypothetical protein